MLTAALPPVDLDKTVDAIIAPGRSVYSGAEWTARVELAALYRTIHLYGMSDLVNGAIGEPSDDMGDAADSHRQRLVEIDAELWALPADAFARKFALRTEADALRSELAEQATRIVSPIEGGGGTG